MNEVRIRIGDSSDIEAAVEVWRRSHTERLEENSAPPEHEARSRKHIENPDSFLVLAERDGEVSGMACGEPGLAEDGAGARIEGLCHIAMVFVAPEFWGEGIGKMLVDATLDEAHSRGYEKTQLWTHGGNERARRLYKGRGFEWSGREAEDDLGARIVHYERDL